MVYLLLYFWVIGMIVGFIVGGIVLTVLLVACETVLEPWITRQASEVSIIWHLWRLEKTMPNTYIETSCEGLEANPFLNERHAHQIRMEMVEAVKGGLLKSNSPDLNLVVDAYVAEVHHRQEIETANREIMEKRRETMQVNITQLSKDYLNIEKQKSIEELNQKKQRPKGRRAWVEASALASHKERQ